MKRKDYVRDETGELFVSLDNSGLHPIIILTDQINRVWFKGLKDPFISVATVLQWYKKELEYGTANNYSEKELNRFHEAIRVFSNAMALNEDVKT